MPICMNCNCKFPNHIKIKGKSKNLSSRKYCLNCSPFGKHNTRKIHEDTEQTRHCPRCKHTLPKELFYNRRGKEFSSVYCKSCTAKQTVDRQRRFKQQCVEYKGGKCTMCNYEKCLGAMEFHHMNPAQKDFSISKSKSYRFDDKIKSELDKCLLLCANCHRETHERIHLAGFEPATDGLEIHCS